MKKTLIAALVLVLIYNLLFFKTQIGLGTGLIFLILNSYFFFIREKNSQNITLGVLFSTLSTISAFLVSFRANEIVAFINLMLASAFSSVALYLYKLTDEFHFRIPEFLFTPLFLIRESLTNFFKLIFKDGQSSEVKGDPSSQNFSHITRGIIIALPIFGLLTFILSSGDPIFGKYVTKFFENIWERILVSALVFLGLVFMGLSAAKKILGNELKVFKGKEHELTIILGSIVLLFASFIAVQFRYLFSKVSALELSEIGIKSLTFSEYVRKGFFELLIASAIASVVIIYALRYLHKLSNKFLVQVLSGILTLEVGILILSAIQRLNLYLTDNGLTRARIFGFIFLIWLSTILIIFLIKIFKELSQKVLFSLSLIVTLMAFLSISLINIDGLIATRYRPTVNEEIDHFYILGLSADASIGWKENLAETSKIIGDLQEDNDISEDDNRKLYYVRFSLFSLDQEVIYLRNKYKNISWQSFNLSEYLAYQDIQNNKATFSQIPYLLRVIDQIEGEVTEKVRQNTQYDRDFSPPFVTTEELVK